MADIEEEKLIIEVQSRPIIYNKSLNDYKKTNKREDAWQEIGETLKTDVSLCKKRWRSLRDCFIKIHRLQKNTPSGAPGGKRKIWAYYTLLDFLIPHVDFKETTGNYLSDTTMEETTTVEETTAEDYFENTIESTTEYQNTQLTSQATSHSEILDDTLTHTQETEGRENKLSTKRTLQRHKKKSDEAETKLLNILTKDNDYDESFLLSLLPTFRRLNPQQNAKARLKIQQILYEIEFETSEYGSSAHSNRSSRPESALSGYYPPSTQYSNENDMYIM